MMSIKEKLKWQFIGVVALAIITGIIAYPQTIKFVPPLYNFLEKPKINLGLDLQGGYRLEYEVDTSKVPESKREDALQAAQDVLERKVNMTGTSEALVQSIKTNPPRIIVEYPGAKSADELKKLIKETPYLEFKVERSPEELDAERKKIEAMLKPSNDANKKKAEEILKEAKNGSDFSKLAKKYSQDPGSKNQGGDLGFVKKGQFVSEFDKVLFDKNFKKGEVWPKLVESKFGWHIIKKLDEKGSGDDKEIHAQHILFAKQTPDMFGDNWKYKSTDLTGKDLESAEVTFASRGLSKPQVALKFNSEGAKKFAKITKDNIGKQVAIYLDGKIISAPVVQTEITNGQAVITGNFTLEEAKNLKKRLNEGALPVPIKLVSQQSVGASLGKISLEKSLKAGVAGLVLVGIFMIVYYRFLGFIAVIGLLIYSAMMISIFKLSGSLSSWPITLTLSGIAGFILSVGMAIDANVLIFERIKEELREGRGLESAIEEGFRRAWPSIRDGNYSTIITSVILVSVGTGFIKGFAVILIIGVLLSMFTAIVLVKIMVQFLAGDWLKKRMWLIKK